VTCSFPEETQDTMKAFQQFKNTDTDIEMNFAKLFHDQTATIHTKER